MLHKVLSALRRRLARSARRGPNDADALANLSVREWADLPATHPREDGGP